MYPSCITSQDLLYSSIPVTGLLNIYTTQVPVPSWSSARVTAFGLSASVRDLEVAPIRSGVRV